MHLLVASHKFKIKSLVYATFHYARCRRLSGVSKLCRFAMQGLSATLVDYALVLAKNMEKFVCNFRWMILLLIQRVTVVKVTNVKAAGSRKRQIPVEVVSLTVRHFYFNASNFIRHVILHVALPDVEIAKVLTQRPTSHDQPLKVKTFPGVWWLSVRKHADTLPVQLTFSVTWCHVSRNVPIS